VIKYITKRVIYGIITIWIVATITFFLLHCLPGDPFESKKVIPPAIKALLYKKYHLDQPLLVQYWYYIKSLACGDFGQSMLLKNRSVDQIILTHFPYSLLVGILGTIFSLVVGVTLGIISGIYRGKKWDTLALVIATLGMAVPSFILAGFIQYIVVKGYMLFGVEILPIAGASSLRYFILPAIVLGLGPVAYFTRMIRASIIDVLGQDYIRTAKAKGVSSGRIIVFHCLRNAIMPILSIVGVMLAGMVTGSFVIENMFAIPGLGQYYVQSIENNDYTVVLGVTVFYAILVVFMMVVTDILYGLVDPRIRVTEKGE